MPPKIRFSEREKNLLMLTIAAVVFYAFFQFFLTPKWDEIGALKEQARGSRLQLRIAEGKIQVLDAIEKKVGSLFMQAGETREEKALEVLRGISHAIAGSGLNLLLIKPIITDDQEKLSFTISCSGSYKNLYNFFTQLKNIRGLVLIDNLDVTGTGGKAPGLDIKINLMAYY
jgi:Tfp pilus assembly protein PilO